MHLFQALGAKVSGWREQRFLHAEYPVIGEILEWAANPDVSNFRLRAPQLRALETYWYLRLVEQTPTVFDLYQRLFPEDEDPDALMTALGVPNEAFQRSKYSFPRLWQSIRTDDAFVKEFRLEALRETLSLQYPSYILALAMGAGKTVLIGAIFATEFAMALEYPEGPFVENALVFAPGKTIIESLRELAEMRYEAVLPPRMYKSFAAALKLTFTRDGAPDIPIIRGSSFNVIVTNTEKIRIQKETIRKADLGGLFSAAKEDEARAEVANLRLQAIASLPKLAIFSDEAHHTYGQALDQDLKKVRKTVDYLHNPHSVDSAEREAHNTNLICVINTTGTPYFQSQPLRDVVIWYGLSEGIRDGILKELAGNVLGFDFEGNVEGYLAYLVTDFFETYGDATLPDGTPAKLAIFFPQTDDVAALRPVVDAALARLGLPNTLVLEHHTKNDHKTDFDRFKSKDSPHRVALLVDRGVEGWNVPALFACALARKLKSSNNFVLQAASRCLRQVAGNARPARIYLSMDNRSILDKQLQETYGESFAELTGTQNRSRTWTIRLRKVDVPPLVVRKTVRRVERTEAPGQPVPVRLTLPQVDAATGLVKTTFSIGEPAPGSGYVLHAGEREEIAGTAETLDYYRAAGELARTYRLDVLDLLGEVRRVYAEMGGIPAAHLPALGEQIEAQTRSYRVVEEVVEVALALVKPGGYARQVDEGGSETYTAEISYPISKEHLLAHYEQWKGLAGPFGFHYEPYNFDSAPERNFFEQVLQMLKLRPGEVEDVYFTGGISDPKKTDFFVEYRGTDDRWHAYSPDFIVRRKDGRCLIVEIKSERERDDAIDGENGRKALATRKWTALNPEQLKYQMVFVAGEAVGYEDLGEARKMME